MLIFAFLFLFPISDNYPAISETKEFRLGISDEYFPEESLTGSPPPLRKKAAPEKEDNFFARYPVWYKIKIDSSGLYKITGKELKKVGLNPSTVNPIGFKLFNIGKFLPPVFYPETMIEIPIYLYTGGDGKFDDDDYILFYGEGVSRWDEKRKEYFQDIFSRYNYYWLTHSSEPGKRMEVISPSLSGERIPIFAKRHIEKELLCPPRGGTLWLWEEISLEPKTFTFSFPESESLISLTIKIFSPARNFSLLTYGNGSLLDSSFIPAAGLPQGKIITINYPIPLSEGRLSITLRVEKDPGQDAGCFLDFFQFTLLPKREITSCGEVFTPKRGDFWFLTKKDLFIVDVSDPFSPKFLLGEKKGDTLFLTSQRDSSFFFLSPISQARKVLGLERKDLSSSPLPHLSADFLIVAPKPFSRLANLFAQEKRRSSALSVEYALLEDIYDFYLFGLEEPYALKRFFKKKRPVYGLLLGDGDYDYRNLFSEAKPKIPPYEYGSGFDYNVYERYPLALDAWYADSSDLVFPSYPNFILGRLPVRNEKEGLDYLAKLKKYERQPDSYVGRFLFVADDEYLGDPSQPDNTGLGVHIRSCEYLERLLPNHFEVKKVYLTEYPLSAVKDKPLARKAFSDEIADGVLGVIYFGHGAGFRLAHEQLLNIEDVFNLKSNGQYPFGYFGSCGVGRFDDFELGRYREAIAEDLVRNPDGFIATIACTKASSPGTNERLCEVLLSSLFSGLSLGESFFYAQRNDISYHLFGDPTLKIPLPPRANFPVLRRDTLRPKRLSTFSCSLGLAKERTFSARAFSGRRLRRYTSTVYYNGVPHLFRIDYILPGFRIASQKGKDKSSFLEVKFLAPAGLPLDTVGDLNNFYWEIPNTARVNSFIREGDSSYFFLWDSIARDTLPGEIIDWEGPKISLFAEGKELKDTTFLPKSFLLTGELSDPSGIFISPYLYYPRLFVNQMEVSLSPAIKETYSGNFSFSLPITLSAETTELTVVSYDNLLNYGEKRVKVITALFPRLTLTEPLAYPGKGYLLLSFNLSYPALVEVKLFTLSGRFVHSFKSFFPSGRNTAQFPISLPRGVYLYKMTAHSFTLNQKAEVYEKVVIR